MYAGYVLTSITAYNLLVYSTVSHDESFSPALSVVGSTGSAEGERRLRILNISAQKPYGTGSGTFLAQTVAAQVAPGHLTAVVCGIDDGDAIDVLPAQALVFPVRFNTSELPFHVCGMSDEMPYAATRYRDLTPQMVGQFESAFAARLDRVAAGEAAVGITYIDNTLDDILADGTLEVVSPRRACPTSPTAWPPSPTPTTSRTQSSSSSGSSPATTTSRRSPASTRRPPCCWPCRRSPA